MTEWSEDTRNRLENPRFWNDAERHRHDIDAVLAELDRRAERIAELTMVLQEIAKGEGRFSRDQFEHACNTVEDMKGLADKALNGSKQE